jgi:hypothetical protein
LYDTRLLLKFKSCSRPCNSQESAPCNIVGLNWEFNQETSEIQFTAKLTAPRAPQTGLSLNARLTWCARRTIWGKVNVFLLIRGELLWPVFQTKDYRSLFQAIKPSTSYPAQNTSSPSHNGDDFLRVSYTPFFATETGILFQS